MKAINTLNVMIVTYHSLPLTLNCVHIYRGVHAKDILALMMT